MTHADLQAQVVDLLHATGFSHLHVRKSIGSRGGGRAWQTTTNIKGWPDIEAWSTRQPGRHLAIEIKVPPDKVRPEQGTVLNELAAAGFECWVVWPEDIDRLAVALRPGNARTGTIINRRWEQS